MAFTATLITVVVAIITLVVGYQWGYGKAGKEAEELNDQQVAAQLGASGGLEEEVRNTTSYQGLVTGINGNRIDINAKVAENDIIMDRTVEITTTDSTVFRKIDITKPPTIPEESEGNIENGREKIIQLDDIQIGDNILAEASENIYGKTSFQTYEIKVLSIGL